MLTHPDDSSVSNPRTEAAKTVHHLMTRFPLVVEILKELGQAPVPFPGDSDIQHGCRRALTSMLVELSRIEPAPPGPCSKSEETASKWLHGRAASELIDADQLERFQHFFDRILDPRTQHN